MAEDQRVHKIRMGESLNLAFEPCICCNSEMLDYRYYPQNGRLSGLHLTFRTIGA